MSEQLFQGDWYNTRYKFKILESGPEKASVQFSAAGKTGPWEYLEFVKTVTLLKDESRIRVSYEIKNPPFPGNTVSCSPWFHQTIGPKDEVRTYFLPTETGIQKIEIDQQRANNELWYNNPSRGWTGVIGRKTGTGVVCTMDYQRLKCFYNWFGRGNDPMPTVEWRFNEVSFPAGASFSTDMEILPFSGLASIEGASAGIVGSIEMEDKYPGREKIPVRVKLVSGKKREVNIQLRARMLPEKEWKNVGMKTISLEVDEVKENAFTFHPDKEGTWVISAVVREKGGVELADLERPMILGKSSGIYTMLPPEGEIKRADEIKTDLDFTSNEVSTPHFTWAKPYYAGTTKTLILVDGFYHHREAVELAERMDLKVKTSFITGGPKLPWVLGDYYDLNEGIMLGSIRKAVWEENDVIVIASGVWRYFDSSLKETIAEKVKEGAGLIFIDPIGIESDEVLSKVLPVSGKISEAAGKWMKKTNHFLTEGIPFYELPAAPYHRYKASGEVLATINGDPLMVVGEYGQGRVVVLNYLVGSTAWANKLEWGGYGLTPNLNHESHDTTFHYWEYYHSLLAKCIVWAAKKELDVRIDGIEQKGEEVYVRLRTEAARKGPLLVSLILRDKYSAEVGNWEKSVLPSQGITEVVFALPEVLKNGLHFSDVLVKEDNNIVNWGTGCFRITNDLGIASINLDKDSYGRGELLAGTVKMKGQTDEKHSLRLSLIDSYGRLIAQEQKSASIENINFRFKLDDILSSTVRIKCELYSGEKVIDEAVEKAIVRPEAGSGWDDLLILMWTSPTFKAIREYLFPAYYKRIKELGVDAVSLGNYVARLAKRELDTALDLNLRLTNLGIGNTAGARSQLLKPGEEGKKEYLARASCWSNPRNLENYRRHAGYYAEQSKKYGVLDYDLADEVNYTCYNRPYDFCFSDYCLKDFRKWLKEEYGTLEALNKEWETGFSAWDEVMPMTKEEVKRRGNYSPWADHRTFNEIVFSRAWKTFTDAIIEVDPQAKVGVVGTHRSSAYGGFDWWRLSKSFTEFRNYNLGDQITVRKSFVPLAPEGEMISLRLKNQDLRHEIWQNLLRGCVTFGFCSDIWELNPDFTYSQAAKSLKNCTEELKKGIAKTLVTSQLQQDPIAIYYSMSSFHGAFIVGKEEIRHRALAGFNTFLRELGFQYGYISYEQVEKGELLRKGLKVLIMPYCVAISAKEAEAIRNFVRNGGVLIADFQTGVMDEHCRTLPSGQLDELFGIKRKNVEVQISDVNLIGKANAEDINLDGKTLKSGMFEPKLELIGGKALACEEKTGSPVIIANQYGKGKTVYLNSDIFSVYPSLREIKIISASRAESIESLGRQILQIAGVTAPVCILTQSGKPLPYSECSRFKRGVIEYVGIIRDYSLAKNVVKTPEKVTIKMPFKAHIYDVLEGRYCGQDGEVTALIGADTVKLYALLPYKVKGLNLAIKSSYNPGDVVEYEIEVDTDADTAGDHIVRLEISNPQGEEVEPYCKNLLLTNGKLKGRIPLALNDPQGKWKIKVKDVLTGISKNRAFVVQKGEKDVYSAD